MTTTTKAAHRAGRKLHIGYSPVEIAIYDFPVGTPGKKWNRKFALMTLPRTAANTALCQQIVAALGIFAAAKKVVETSGRVSPMGDGSLAAIRSGKKYLIAMDELRAGIAAAEGRAND